MVSERIIKDTDFLANFLADPEILSGNPLYCNLEIGKEALDLYHKFETNPLKITLDDIIKIATNKESRIYTPEKYILHVKNTAEIMCYFVKDLSQKYPDLNLLNPEVAYVHGLIHDLGKVISKPVNDNYEAGNFIDFFLAKRFGWKNIESYTSMHSVHLEAFKLIYRGDEFSNKEDYKEIRKIFNDHLSPLYYPSIENQFNGLINGRENQLLILLTVADYTADENNSFKKEEFNERFNERTKSILSRYCKLYKNYPEKTSLIGKALIEGGMDRVKFYKEIVLNLLESNG